MLTEPLWLHAKLSEKDCPNDDVAINQFMFTKRAGIAHTVGVSRFMANLSKVHYEAMKSIMRYFKGKKSNVYVR